MSDAAKFWERLMPEPNTGCWLWTRGATTAGYGHLSFNGKIVYAHRLAWELTHGAIGDACVLHRCDTPACANPDHLFLGTVGDNNRDMAAKGRHFTRTRPERVARGDRHGTRRHPERVSRGERNANAILTEEDVREIRRLRTAGQTLVEIAQRFGTSHQNVIRIVNRTAWRHVA